MATYTNINAASSIAAVEFSPVSDGNFSFFHIRSPENKEEIKQWLTSKGVGQEIVAETMVGGKPVLVTRGEKTKDELTKLLEAQGEKLQFVPPPKKSIDTWKIISMFAVPGQTLQMTSAFMKPKMPGKKGTVSWDLFIFAGSSLLGHIIGWVYGSQKSDDEYREDFIKQKINKKLDGHLPNGAKLPDIQDDRSSLRNEPKGPASAGQKVNDFLRENSVTFGELFLRYFGAFALAFPVNKWKAGFGKLKVGAFKEAYKAAGHDSGYLRFTGLASMFGKTVALFAKAPDPYDPKPKTWLDTLREKYIFNIGGNIEAAAYATMSYEAFINPKNRIVIGGKQHQNFLSGIGASMFATRYVIRNWAKYGEKEIDMNEVRAHATDSLAKMPPDKLPQLLADTAADLTDHFKDKHLEYSQVFTQLMSDLYRYHHIALTNLGTEPEERMAKVTAQQPDLQPGEAPVATQTLKSSPRNMMERVTAPAGKHAEKISKAGDMPLGMGA